VLDLCAGSGCIGVAVAKAVPGAWVDFGEIDPAHLPTIEKNLSANLPDDEYSNRLEYYRVIQSDLFEKITDAYDFILTNPPYIDPALDRTEGSVKTHESHKALNGGVAGMELIKIIISESSQYLKPQGQLWVEHEPEQVKEIHALAAKLRFVAITHKDQYDVERYTVLVVQ